MNVTIKVIFLESMSCNDFPTNKDIGVQTMKMQFGTTLSTVIGKYLKFKILEQPIHLFTQMSMTLHLNVQMTRKEDGFIMMNNFKAFT